MRDVRRLWAPVGLLLTISGCREPGPPPPYQPPPALSSFGLFAGHPGELRPAESVLEYELNTPAFANYAGRQRLLKLPAGSSVPYQEETVLELPVGTVIAETRYYALDARAAEGPRRLLETRVLVHDHQGWLGFPYVWNEEQSDAHLAIIGAVTPVEWTDPQGEPRHLQHVVPNLNQCKSCHRVRLRTMQPIGLRVSQLNRPRLYADGEENQLARWSRLGILSGAPPPQQAARLPVWNDPASGSLEARARAWLDINCAHCHNPGGKANMSSLDLRLDQSDATRLGIRKAPVAAGTATGGRLFDIVPGRPDDSILVYRLESLDPGVMMPEIGRSAIDREGIDLIRRWIAAMPDSHTAKQSGP